MPSYLNEPLISLIPKCQNPESLSNYRPINLCNSIYKIVSKIIVGHIRPHLSKLISPVQMAFIPSHRGLIMCLSLKSCSMLWIGRKEK